MLSWLAKQVMSFTMARTRAGDVRPTLLLDAPDVRFTFPGSNSWSGVMTGRAEVRRWLERFARVGLQPFPDEVVVKGFPWNMTICVRAHDHLKAPDGQLVYENRFVIWGRMAWGRVKEYEVYMDTEKVKAFDEWLTVNEPSPMA